MIDGRIDTTLSCAVFKDTAKQWPNFFTYPSI